MSAVCYICIYICIRYIYIYILLHCIHIYVLYVFYTYIFMYLKCTLIHTRTHTHTHTQPCTLCKSLTRGLKQGVVGQGPPLDVLENMPRELCPTLAAYLVPSCCLHSRARKLEHGRPPTANQRKKEHKHKSSYIHIPGSGVYLEAHGTQQLLVPPQVAPKRLSQLHVMLEAQL